MLDKKFYVYVHRYASGPKKGQIFYVGKGVNARHKSISGRNKHWHNIVNKYGFISHIVFRFRNEECSFSFEVALIKNLGKENLCNISDGGERNSGWNHSEDWRIAASKMRSGENNPNYGRTMCEDQKKSISLSLKGRPSPKKGKASNHDKISQSQKMKLLHALPSDENPFFFSQKNKTQGMKIKLSKPVKTSCGKVFFGINEASRWLRDNGFKSATHGPISLCCAGKRKTAYGYKWSYVDECRV